MLLLILTSLLQVAISAVYYVKPDSEKRVGQNTLKYYQRTGKLSSNTQLYFTPGSFKLSTPLIISNVTNFSLIGSSSGQTTIFCINSEAGVLLTYSDTIKIENMEIKHCGYIYSKFYKWKSRPIISNLMIVMCGNLVIQNSTFYSKSKFGLSIRDPIGCSSLLQVSSNAILIGIHTVTNNINLTIIGFRDISPADGYVVSFILDNHSRKINIIMSQMRITNHLAINIESSTCTGANVIRIYQLNLESRGWLATSKFAVFFLNVTISCASVPKYGNLSTHIEFNNCEFKNIYTNIRLFNIYTQQNTESQYPILFHIINSFFYDLKNTQIAYSRAMIPSKRKPLVVLFFTNSTFKQIITSYLMNLAETLVIIKGPTYFTKIKCITSSTCIKTTKGIIKFQNYIEFSFIESNVLLNVEYIILEWNTVVNFTANKFKEGITFPNSTQRYQYLLCAFQYIDTLNTPNSLLIGKAYNKSDYLIIFSNNSGGKLFSKRHSTSHCSWIENSVFLTSDPEVINEQLIEYSNNSFDMIVNNISNRMCLCRDAMNFDCSVDKLQPIYPGQKYSLRLIDKAMPPVLDFKIDESPFTSCKTQTEFKRYNIFQNCCTTVELSIQFKNRRSCELFIRGRVSTSIDINEFNTMRHAYEELIDVYHISMIPCPVGFILNDVEGFCQCDPLLKGNVIFITDCNINDQTILRPANSWISGDTVNNSYTYDVSLECPFDYCIPHQSYINLATPDLRCQFNRCGVLCGHCPPGHSAVFGSSQCKHCSNVYLLIIIPIAITGIVLVFLLFLLNLTVTDGSITPFIYYVNIISINSAVFFSERHTLFTQITYAFVSVANLDLGIETCFYDGMTGYAKIFLQLVFPFYLLSIAILLIVASRYFTKIQRLTARRALPVLATLFILSYTKILQTVCTALFFYSSVTHLPNKHTTVMWSVDTSIKIFETKFILLFVVCLILFLLLMMFNVVLLFIRYLSRFKFINHFKPLLDAYQGPYKDKFYFWTGLQLVTRVIFFGLSALDRNIALVLGGMLLCVIASMYGLLHPYARKEKNSQEVVFLLNLQGLFLLKAFTEKCSIPVNIFVTLSLLQFGIILVKQITVNMPQDKAEKLLNIFPSNCKLLCKAKKTQVHNIELKSMVPEKSIYCEFQEPLLQEL